MQEYWTPEKDALLIEYRRAGHSFGSAALLISEKLGKVITRNSCISRWSRLGLANTVSKAQPRIRRKPKARTHRVPPKVSAFIKHIVADDRPLRTQIEAAPPKLLSLAQLADDLTECRFHIGHVGDHGSGFCGHQTIPGVPYCEAHARLCYDIPPLPRSVRQRVSVSQQETEVAV